jgi:hypothetical protein
MLEIGKVSARLVDPQDQRGTVKNHGERVPAKKPSTTLGYCTQ